MMQDPIRRGGYLKKDRAFLISALFGAIAVFIATYPLFLMESGFDYADLRIHAYIAADFDFSDLHTITSRLSYPVWHVLVSVLNKLGMTVEHAASAVCSFMKAFTFVCTYWLITAMAGEKTKKYIVFLLSLFMMMVTGVRIPGVNDLVYRGGGSPNVWHNPTQITVTASMMLIMPWLCHCWYEFERGMEQDKFMLPWWKIIVLAVLAMGSVACKPTFMQALLPAAFVMYAVELIRHRKQWRYFGQIVLAFVPAAGYFLLSFLYYTGVVVEFTSGVTVSVSAEDVRYTLTSIFILSACPLIAIPVCFRKGMFKNRMLVLALLMIVFGAIEGMMFHETGMREGHGNFRWASGNASFWLWVVMIYVFLRTLAEDFRAGRMPLLRRIGYGAVAAAFLWHLGSAIYYIYYLVSFQNAF